MDVLLPVLLALAGGGLLGVFFQERRARRAEPAADAKDTVTLQLDVIQAFREANTLHIEDTKTQREQAATITALSNANTDLIKKIDGLPQMVGEQAAQLLVKEGFAELLKTALEEAGVARIDQPQEAPKLPLTQLTPPTLLEDLAGEKAKDLEEAGGVIDLPPEDKE